MAPSLPTTIFGESAHRFAKLAEAPIECPYKITSQKKKKKLLDCRDNPKKQLFIKKCQIGGKIEG
jgi:hypothetical protein